MVTNEQRRAILAHVSPRRILSLAADLDALDRQPGGEALEGACERLAAHLRRLGTDRVELKTFPCGPEHRYFGWTVERRPVTEEAELWLRQLDGRESLLCRSSDDPRAFMGAYRATPPEGEVFEVVDVGFGTRSSDYRSQRLPGKVALVSGHHFEAAMLEALSHRHAEGLLCGPGRDGTDPRRVAPRRLGDPSLFGRHRPFGFNLDLSRFTGLAGRLAVDEPLWVRAKLTQTMDTGTLAVVGAALEGSDLSRERVLLVCDMGMGEGVLGAACAVEVLHALKALAVRGVLPPLRRTVQLMVVPGVQATVAWLAESRAEIPDLRAAIHLTLPCAASASSLRVHAPPPTCLSFTADLIEDHLRGISTLAGEIGAEAEAPLQVEGHAYAAASPVFPFGDRDVGVPAVWVCGTDLCRGPASEEPWLRQVVAGLASAIHDLGTLAEVDVPRLVSSSQCRGLTRLVRRAEGLREVVQKELPEAPRSSVARHLLWLCDGTLREGLRREQETLRSCGDYLAGPGQQALRVAEAASDGERVTASLLRSLVAEVACLVSPRARLSLKRLPLTPLERRAQLVVPHRLFSGPLPLPTLLREATAADRDWLAHNADALSVQPVGEVALQWVDSERTLLEIYDLLCFDATEPDLKLVWRYLETLEAAGLLRLEEREAGMESLGEKAPLAEEDDA